MFREVYEKLENKEKEKFLSEVHDFVAPLELEKENASVIRCPIDFYPEQFLYEVIDNKVMPPARRFFVTDEKKSNFEQIDYSSERIYQLNEKFGIFLDQDLVIDYIKFFFNFARGRHGRFSLIDSVDDVNWQEEPPLAARRAIASMIEAPKLLNENNGRFVCQACLIFKDSLIRASIRVETSGKVEIHEEEILVEDMPIIDDNFS